MTRQEFIDNVTEWYELKNFCYNNDCDVCEDIYDEDGMDEEINYSIREYAGDYSWHELRDELRSIPSGYDYYRQNGLFDWDGMDDDADFQDYKDSVLEWMDNGEYWEDDEDDESYYEDDSDNKYEDEQEETVPVEEEDFTVGDLIGMCSVKFVAIQHDNLRHEEESNAAFRQYVGANVPKVLS